MKFGRAAAIKWTRRVTLLQTPRPEQTARSECRLLPRTSLGPGASGAHAAPTIADTRSEPCDGLFEIPSERPVAHTRAPRTARIRELEARLPVELAHAREDLVRQREPVPRPARPDLKARGPERPRARVRCDMKALCDAPEPIRPDGSPHVVPAQVAHDRIMSLEAEGSAGLRSRFRAHAGALRPAGDRLHGPPGKAVAANRGYANGGHASSGRAACGSSSAALEGSPHWIVLLTTFEGALCVPSLARLTRAEYQVPAARFCTR